LAAVRARFGIPPERLPLYVALVGDPSDNIPKLPGIGPRTASALCTAHGSAAALLEHLDAFDDPRVRQTLAAHREQLLQNESLVRLHDDLDLGGEPGTRPLSAQAQRRTRELFLRLEFKSLVPRLDALPVRDY
jgi:DNA polymerase-1